MAQMTSGIRHIVVVGAGLAGARACEQLRLQGFDGELTVVGEEHHAPYDRPPLSKDVLSGRKDDSTLGVDFAQLRVSARLGEQALALSVREKAVMTSAGVLTYDALVIATGARARRLPGDGQQFTVRTIDDALQLRERLTPGARVVIVGAGWLGAEIAGAAVARGCRVTAIEVAHAPLEQVLGPEVARRALPWWSEVDLRTGIGVRCVSDGGVVLSNGEWLASDVTVTAIGGAPNTEWLESSELALDRGVVVDEWLRAAPGIVAVGDVAAWWSRTAGRRLRVEHWDNAASGSAVAAATLLNPGLIGAEVHDPVPYFWSDQFGHKLQYVGHHTATDDVVFRDHASGAWTAVWLDPERRITGVLVADLPREFVQGRIALSSGMVADPAVLGDPSVPLSQCGALLAG